MEAVEHGKRGGGHTGGNERGEEVWHEKEAIVAFVSTDKSTKD